MTQLFDKQKFSHLKSAIAFNSKGEPHQQLMYLTMNNHPIKGLTSWVYEHILTHAPHMKPLHPTWSAFAPKLVIFASQLAGLERFKEWTQKY